MDVQMFSNMVFWHTRTINRNFGESRETKISFRSDLRRNNFFRKSFVFRLAHRTFIVFKGGSEIAEILLFIVR